MNVAKMSNRLVLHRQKQVDYQLAERVYFINFIQDQCLINIQMYQEERCKITRKPLKGKQINTKLVRWTKPNTSFSTFQDRQDKRKDEYQRNINLKINQQSISFIAKKHEGSFISNNQDRSLDSFDKMIIGDDEELDLQDNTEGQQPDYTFLYGQFQKLCKYDSKQKQQSHINSQDSILGSQQKGSKEQAWQQSDRSNNMGAIVRQRLQEVKEMLRQRSSITQVSSDPNISIRMLGANLSEIHEEEIQHNSSLQPMDAIEEEFIDFVSKGGPSKINISKIEEHEAPKGEEKKVSNKSDVLKETQEDEVVAMLENELISRVEPQEESINDDPTSLNKKNKKQKFSKQNYNPILCELQENEQKKQDSNETGVASILARRCEWINNRADRSQRWKNHELRLVCKFRQILQNAYAEFSDEEDFQLQT